MTYETQELGNFFEAKKTAESLLQILTDVQNRTLSFPETIVLQGASHLLQQQDEFYGGEIVRLGPLTSGVIYPISRRLEKEGVFTSENTKNPGRGRQVSCYQPTDLGSKILELFQQGEQP